MNNQMPKNPYPGLRPFEFAENHLFFGREGQSENVLSRLQTSRFVAVVGTSGSGKSSLVRAGLLPLLYGGFMGAVGSRWRVAMFRPGDNPIHNLAAALVAPSESVGDKEKSKIAFTETVLRRSAVGLRDCARGADFAADENLLVVVDQFEEIFRFTKKATAQNGANGSKPPEQTGNEAAAFIKLLLEAVRDETNRVYVVITIRPDFLGDCAQFRDLPEAINNGQYSIPRLTREQLRRVIESPAKVRRVQIAPALTTRLLNDIEDDQDQLPVLQHALMRTWDKWTEKFQPDSEIGLADYEAAGKFTDALSLHAEEAFSELGSETSVKPGEQIKIENFYLPEAKDVLRGKVLTADEMLDLAKKLKSVKAFNYARRILARAAADSTVKQGSPLKLKIHQEWSLCTYKDSDSPADARLDKALDILCDVEDLATTTNQETLGLAGAIYKRKWEIDNQKLQLERALLYYERGYNQGAANDQGYTGINAAFVLDLLARQEEQAANIVHSTSAIARERQAQARLIREDLVETLPPLIEREETGWLAEMWWFYSTVAEAYFGLKQYEQAIEWLNRGKEKIERIPDWEIESTTSELARLAILQTDSSLSGDGFQDTPAWNALQKFFGNNTAAVRSAFVGKIGLALSGGGFRASLFHIGMLAKLAELDVLRQVEVLSCVSGGSIVGAHYYLEVRHLLQSKTDAEITKQDYINIVRRIEKDFLAGVQRNVRMRIAADPITNLKMIFSSAYSRSMRAGELYEKEIFSRVKDGGEENPRYLNELNIYPKGEGQDFAPKLYNWRRTAKAPILILNATTLNTGHNWQFTTTWMGEPPSSIDVEVDTNDQLRRMYYTEAPEQHRKIRLGHAVSASAAVPGIFEPLPLENLYPDRIVRLADGGGTDNQGLGGLLEQDCTIVLISDGSGQMESQNTPSSGLLGVLLRSSSILQSRIRDVQYHDLERRKRSSLLRGLMFIHLKEDLDSDPIDWVDCLDPFAGSIDARPPSRQGILTRYGIAKEIQTRLAGIRTDLDSFTDVEAYTLMTSAYRMTEDAFVNTKCVEGFSGTGEPVEWKFLKVEEAMKGTGKKYQHIKNLLDTSGMMAFKVWKQSAPLKYTAWFLALAGFVLLVWGFFIYSQFVIVEPITLGVAGKWILGMIAAFAVAYFLGGWLMKVVRWRETLIRVIFGVVMSVFGWLIARLHLHVFDRLFLRRGSLDAFRRQASSGQSEQGVSK